MQHASSSRELRGSNRKISVHSHHDHPLLRQLQAAQRQARHAASVEASPVLQKVRHFETDAFKDERDVYVVQDHERALWGEESKVEMRRNGLRLLENYPKCSQEGACRNP